MPCFVWLSRAHLGLVGLQVKEGLVPLLAELRSKGVPPSDSWLKGDYDTEKQVHTFFQPWSLYKLGCSCTASYAAGCMPAGPSFLEVCVKNYLHHNCAPRWVCGTKPRPAPRRCLCRRPSATSWRWRWGSALRRVDWTSPCTPSPEVSRLQSVPWSMYPWRTHGSRCLAAARCETRLDLTVTHGSRLASA